MPKHDLSEILDKFIAKQAIQSACIDVLLLIIEALTLKLGVSALDGLTPRDFFHQEKYKRLEEILISYEDKDPGAAAFIQNVVDKFREKE